MISRFTKLLVSFGVLGGTAGLGLGIGDAVSSAATTTMTPGSTATTVSAGSHTCPHASSASVFTAGH